jgi:predicted Rossmann fold flavoprotein
VGGGPAGIMAACRASEMKARVTLVEKTYRLGSKLLLTGGGRCNITNTADIKGFVQAFGGNGKFLYRALTVFSNQDLIGFFGSRGLDMRGDPDGKVFPGTDSAENVLAVLRAAIEESGVRIIHNAAVTGIIVEPGEGAAVRGVRLADGTALEASAVIVSTGGMSYPKTGSTGDGYLLARQCGHTVTPLSAGLTALESDDDFIKALQGLTLKDIVISVMVDGKKKASEKGDILFTHFGVSGPKVLILSGGVVDALSAGGTVELSLNLRPGFSLEEYDRHLQKEFESAGPKTIPQYLRDALPASFAPVFEHCCAPPQVRKCALCGSAERKKISACFTDFRIHITKPRPIEEATITRGGVSLKEINPQTMESRLVKRLFFCGEVLDIDGITGGYNLQEAFSTGYLAGESSCE